jgi:hypothetical protein
VTDELFTDAELAAVARMLVVMMRIDGRTTSAEREALAKFGERVRVGERAKTGGPYREAKKDVSDAGVLEPYLARAGALPITREAFFEAASSITDEDTREAVYAALYDLAASDLIVEREWALLERLADVWNLKVE